jgi:hypothetical protein
VVIVALAKSHIMQQPTETIPELVDLIGNVKSSTEPTIEQTLEHCIDDVREEIGVLQEAINEYKNPIQLARVAMAFNDTPTTAMDQFQWIQERLARTTSVINAATNTVYDLRCTRDTIKRCSSSEDTVHVDGETTAANENALEVVRAALGATIVQGVVVLIFDLKFL